MKRTNFWTMTIISTGVMLGTLGFEANYTQAADLNFYLSGSFEDNSFEDFSGIYSYSTETLDQNPDPNVGLYSLSNFEIDIFNANGDNTLKISPSEGWTGALQLASIPIEGFPEPSYTLSFSKDRVAPEPFLLNVSWNWSSAADVAPTTPPTEPLRPDNSYLAVAINADGDNVFYPVQTATAVPEPSNLVGVVTAVSIGIFWIQRKTSKKGQIW